MSVDVDKKKLLSNIKRQSLRLAHHLDLPLNQVHMFLAKYFYDEDSLSELKRKITLGHFDGRIFLAAIAPDASENLLTLFADKFPDILISVANSPIVEIYDGSLPDLVIDVFSLNKNVLNMIGAK